MSAATVLVRFKKTGNIYMGCYEGTSDYVRPYICTPEECWDEKWGCYCAISYCRDRAAKEDYNVYVDVSDWDDVEVYSEWGFSGYFKAVGSETHKIIAKCPLDEFYELDWEAIIHEKPDWVTGFWEELDV